MANRFTAWFRGNKTTARNDSTELAPPPDSSALPPMLRDAHRFDGWFSVLNGIGTNGRDKRNSMQFAPDFVFNEEARRMWQGDDLAKRIIETRPNEMVRAGWELTGGDEGDEGKAFLEDVCQRAVELGLRETFRKGLCYRNAYGGSAVLLGVNDGSTDLREPLDMDKIQSFDWMTLLEPREISPLYWYGDPMAPKYGTPMIYQISTVSPGMTMDTQTFAAVQVHESRLIIFDGDRVSRWQDGTFNGWGGNRLTAVRNVLRDFNAAWSATGIIMTDFAQAVVSIDGLAEIVGKNKSEILQRRMAAIEMSRSAANVVLIDAKEKYERQQTPIAGLSDVLDRFASRLAAAADMPMALLFGQSPSGLGASGDINNRLFYDQISAAQHAELMPALQKVYTIIMSTLGSVPAKWSIKFNPLWQESAKEQAQTRLLVAQTDAILVTNQIVDADTLARCHYGGPEYSPEIHIDVAELDAQKAGEAYDPDDIAATAALNAGAPQLGPDGKPMAPAGQPIQATAYNGVQVTAMQAIVTAVAAKEMSRESGHAMLVTAFQVDDKTAEAILGPQNFEPVKLPPTPAPFGGGSKPPGAPAAPLSKPGDAPDKIDPNADAIGGAKQADAKP